VTQYSSFEHSLKFIFLIKFEHSYSYCFIAHCWQWSAVHCSLLTTASSTAVYYMLSGRLYRNISEIKTVIHCLKQRLIKSVSVIVSCSTSKSVYDKKLDETFLIFLFIS